MQRMGQRTKQGINEDIKYLNIGGRVCYNSKVKIMTNVYRITEETCNGASLPVVGLAGRRGCSGTQCDHFGNVRRDKTLETTA